ncbi:monooxygenase [Bacillus massiliigorillae]|uniref:monooxygenase n=1 Tax=Bacillus massiliigorillae TaxID=1243664 RepID=UPI0003A7D18E|nr:monooxygenase [Bacillus massiliigorillae]
MSQIVLQIDFPANGPFGQEMSEAYAELADHLAKTPGLIWKIWTENAETKEAGGIYLFTDQESAKAYLKEHTARLESFGIQNIRGKIFEINETLSKTTKFVG